MCKGTNQAQEILMTATQRGHAAYIRSDGRCSSICLTELMVTDMVYSEKYEYQFIKNTFNLRIQITKSFTRDRKRIIDLGSENDPIG